jgi:orotidine-5'-phosphate decarboxylase
LAIIKEKRSVIPACDVRTLADLRRLVKLTSDVKGIGGYKVGAILAISCGLPESVRVIREFTDLPIIYDHQKGMTDIPDIGKVFAESVKDSGIDAVIGFPLAGPATQRAWTKVCQDVGLGVIIGGEMTQPEYRRSEGGYLSDEAIDQIYLNGARQGVTCYVIPGNRTERVIHYRELLTPRVKDDLTFFSPGFVSQGGMISDTAKVAGGSWHAIVGRAIYGAEDVHAAAEEMTRSLQIGPT